MVGICLHDSAVGLFTFDFKFPAAHIRNEAGLNVPIIDLPKSPVCI